MELEEGNVITPVVTDVNAPVLLQACRDLCVEIIKCDSSICGGTSEGQPALFIGADLSRLATNDD